MTQALPMKAADLFDLTGEVALVTGASSGLGRRFAQTLAANGARVVVLARRRDRLEALVRDIEKSGGAAISVEADATDEAAMNHAFDAAQKAFGVVTICVANAGLARAGRFIDKNDDDWRDTMHLNLDGVRLAGALAAQRMQQAKKSGAIVNIASILGLNVARGVAAYAVAKAGVIQLTKAMAFELAKYNIRVNAIAPGYFSTEINADFLEHGDGAAMRAVIPLRRFGVEGELDAALLSLTAPRAGGFMTGATIVVDGGQSIALAGG